MRRDEEVCATQVKEEDAARKGRSKGRRKGSNKGSMGTAGKVGKGEWKWESSTPMWNQLWVANMVNNYNERRAAFRGACEYKLEVGKIGKNNEIIPPTEDELLDINEHSAQLSGTNRCMNSASTVARLGP